MNVKEIRKMTGLSQARFGEKYGIPRRTIEAWEAGERTAPEYVTEMLTKIVKLQEVNMKAWMMMEYRDKAGTGSTKLFKEKEDALKYGRSLWHGLNKVDKDSYLDDACGEFLVAEVPIEWDDVGEDWIAVTDDGYDPVWDGIEEERKARAWKALREEIFSAMDGYEDFETFLIEYGWQDWMNEFTDAEEGEEASEREIREIDDLLKRLWEDRH